MLESHLKEAHDERLVQLFGVTVESPYSYWFACRRSSLTRRPVKIFHDWLFDSLIGQDGLGPVGEERKAAAA
jgi:LysR family glycine cleavage system transcriptional activator